MNAYLKDCDYELAITSIGLDGEELDQVTLLEKPQILVKPGYFVATAYETLTQFTCDYKIVEETDILTAIGKVVIVKIINEGKALVAGPAKVDDISKLIESLRKLKINKIIIDGAFSRQSFAKITQATILVIGANYSLDMDKVVYNAKLTYDKLTLPSYNGKGYSFSDKILIVYKDEKIKELAFSSIIGKVDYIFKDNIKDIKLIYFPKSITNKFVESLVVNRKDCDFEIILNSPINIQLSDNNLDKLFKLKNKIYVLNPIEIPFVCCNPYSPKGYEFDDLLFKNKLASELGLQVFNVMKDG